MKEKGRVEERVVLYYEETEMSTGMSIAELIEAAGRVVVTPEDIDALNERLRVADIEFEKETHARSVDEAWLQRQYTI